MFAYFLSFLTTEVLYTVEDKDPLSCIVNIMADDGPATQGAKASIIIILT